MLKQNSLKEREATFIYEKSFVWVHLNSIKKKNASLYRIIYDYFRSRKTSFCFFKAYVNKFVSKDEVEIYVYVNDKENEKPPEKENSNFELIENVRYLLPLDTNFGCSDNTELVYLNSPNLLENVYTRYMKAYGSEMFRNCIYTYIGYILIAVNPYECFYIYSEDYMKKIRNEENLFNIPHPFSIANDAYRCLIKEKISQSIIISGESGSGKTESSKQVLKFLTYLSQCQKEEEQKKLTERSKRKSARDINNIITYEEKIQNSNPLLESFGNAKTMKNDNSSRFGKLMKLNYDEKGSLCSASIETYLLAKSRVVDVPYGESNYHIFYSLCENKKIAEEFHLLPWYKYNYLMPKKKLGNDEQDRENGLKQHRMEEETNEKKEKGVEKKKGKRKNRGSEEKESETEKEIKNKKENLPNGTEQYKCLYDLNVIMKCFNSIGIFEKEQKEIYKTLICILLLGNVDFVESEKEGEALKIKNIEICKTLNKILKLKKENSSDVQKIVEILTIKKVRETQKNYTYQQAIYNRDVIAKALYHLLFEYIILRVNDSLNKNEEQHKFEYRETYENEYEDESNDSVKGHKGYKRRKGKKGDKDDEENEDNTDEEVDIEENSFKDGEYEVAEKLNDKLFHEKNKNYFIGILDIYGFENYSVEGTNGYEQLCINYANEILHSFFLKQIIDNEHKIHCEENLNIPKFQYNDNSIVISLIGDARDASIYTLLEDMALLSCSQKSSEKNKNDLFYEKLNKNIVSSAKYKSVTRIYNNAQTKRSFVISHYAGNVLYDTNDFVNKNMDILTTDIENFLTDCNSFISHNLLNRIKYEENFNNPSENSSSKSISSSSSSSSSSSDDERKKKKKGKGTTCMELKVEDIKQNKRKLSVKEMIYHKETENKQFYGNQMGNIHKNKVKSIFSYFKKQLEMLTNKLNKTSSKFIRCIKPNHAKMPKLFDKNLVLNQLVMSGMVDILNMMKNGFPCRILYDDMWSNYSHILQDDMKEYLTPQMFCEVVLKFLNINHNEYRMGKTKVFFRFGVLSIINEILNKNENKKSEFLECVYKFWLQRRKRRLLNFVLFGCRFKMLFKKRRAKKLMENGLQLYNHYLFQKQLHNIEIILFYYFNVYKARCYFLQLKKSVLVIQKNFRCYITRKKYLCKKRGIIFIQDYYLFHKYFKRRVHAANIIRKNWIMYITKYDYKYVLKCVLLIQKALRRYMKKKYVEYCLRGSIQNKQKIYGNINENINEYVLKNPLVKQELEDEDDKEKGFLTEIHRMMSQKHEADENRVCSFIYIEKKKQAPKKRHSIAFGKRLSSFRKRKTGISNTLKRRKTWTSPEDISNYECNTVHTYKYKHQQEYFNSNYRINVSNEHETTVPTAGKRRASFNEDIPIISVGNNISDNSCKQKGMDYGFYSSSSTNISSNKNGNKFVNRDINQGKGTFSTRLSTRLSNISRGGSSNSSNFNVNIQGKRQMIRETGKGLNYMQPVKPAPKRKSYNQSNTQIDIPLSYQRENKKVSSSLKNTIYDRYVDKYKMTNINTQNNKKKKSTYIKKNYSNISNIYNVLKPSKWEKSKEEYNFDVTDELIIPEHFDVSESHIPEPTREQKNNVNDKKFSEFLDKSVKSKIPIIVCAFSLNCSLLKKGYGNDGKNEKVDKNENQKKFGKDHILVECDICKKISLKK